MEKIKVRKGTFETNSSSTHNLQIEKTTLEEARKKVIDRIRQSYDKKYGGCFNEDEYINYRGNLYLKGLEFESGDEEKNIYYLISNWMAKIQFLAMMLYYNSSRLEGFDNTEKLPRDAGDYCTKLNALITSTKPYTKFCELIKEYILEKRNYTVSNVILDIEYSAYIETLIDSPDIPNIFTDSGKKITTQDIEEVFEAVMKDEYIITFADEAYSPYDAPQIYTL